VQVNYVSNVSKVRMTPLVLYRVTFVLWTNIIL
jgi:hypothetical protein